MPTRNAETADDPIEIWRHFKVIAIAAVTVSAGSAVSAMRMISITSISRSCRMLGMAASGRLPPGRFQDPLRRLRMSQPGGKLPLLNPPIGTIMRP